MIIVSYKEKCNTFYEKKIYKNTFNKKYIQIKGNRMGKRRNFNVSDGNNLTTFHLQLLTNTIDTKKFPFTKLILERNVSEEEYAELFRQLEQFDLEYKEQLEEGLLDYSSLLIKFATILTKKLPPKETVSALLQEGYFPELMEEFSKLIRRSVL